MKSIIITILISLSILQLTAQVPGIEWQRTYGTTVNESFNQMTKTLDGNYIVCGRAGSTISGNKTVLGSIWVFKLDSLGNELNQYGYTNIDGLTVNLIRDIIATKDSGFAIIADLNGPGGENEDYGILKIDKNGSIQFQKKIQGNTQDVPMNVAETLDKGYIIVGESESIASLDKTENPIGMGDVWVVKLDSLGNIQWQNTIGGTLNDIGTYVKQFQDSTYIVVATSSSDISGDKSISTNGGSDVWVLKLDVNGNLISQNQYGGNADDISWNAKAFSNKDVYIAAYSSSGISGNKTEQNYGSSDYWIFKIDSAGTILWQNTIGGSGGDITMGIDVNSAGESFIAGRSNSPMSGEKSENSMGIDYWIVKLNTSGDLVWENTIGGSSTEDTRSIVANSDGSCVAAGVSNSPISGDKSQGSFGVTDFWIVKIEGPGNSPLPLDLVSFTGSTINTTATLQWETANMVNVKGFEVEKSIDAKSFTSIGFVAATSANEYSFIDNQMYERNNYYRLKMKDIDGQFSYSNTITLLNISKMDITLFPNPTSNELTIVSSLPNFAYTVLDVYGHELMKGKSNTASVVVPCASLSKGIYVVQIETTSERKMIKFVKE